MSFAYPRLALSLALAMFSVGAHSASAEIFKADTTRDLVKLCSMAVDDPWYDVSMGFCLGYISSAEDYHAVISSGKMANPVLCPKTAVTRQDVLDAFLAWAKNNDKLLDSEKPIHGLMRAASEKWPCN